MERFKDIFALNRSERRGVMVLLILITLSLIGLIVVIKLPSKPTDIHFVDYEVKKLMIEERLSERQLSRKKRNSFSRKELFSFDPNKLDKAGWIRLGFSEKQANSIVRFRERSFGFKSKEDLKKLFVIDSLRYLELEPFIVISSVPEQTQNKIPERKSLLIDLNKASKEQLQKLYGVGEKLSARIIAYRKLLGGFVSIDQLNDVYGLKSEVINGFSEKISIDKVDIKQLMVKQLNERELKRHPYIDDRLAYIIKEICRTSEPDSFDEFVGHIPPGTELHPLLKFYLDFS